MSDKGIEERRARAAEIRRKVTDQLRQLDQKMFRRELCKCIAAVRKWWMDFPIDPVPLLEAYRLLPDSEIEQAWIADLLDLCGGPSGRDFPSKFSFPPRTDGGAFVFTAFETVAKRLRPAVLAALRDGRLIASGVDPADPVRGKPAVIPAARWGLLAPDWERSAATCDGKTVAVEIVVEAASAASAADGARPNPPRAGELEAWFVNYKKDCDVRGERPSEEATVDAAQKAFNGRARREQVRTIRKKLAPDWNPGKRGPKGPRNSAKIIPPQN